MHQHDYSKLDLLNATSVMKKDDSFLLPRTRKMTPNQYNGRHSILKGLKGNTLNIKMTSAVALKKKHNFSLM